jgi:hypothetical protein
MSSLLSIIKKIFTGGNDTSSPASANTSVTPKKMPAVVLRNGDAMWHLSSARNSEQHGDYLAARMGYLKCVETLKQAGDTDDLTEATSEYENFVRRDPVFKKLLSVLLPFIEANPGIMQSEITKKFVSVDWSALYRYDRPVTREDIYYALYFADKLGHIKRTKKGRSYELHASSQRSMRSSIPVALVAALFFASPAHAFNWTLFTPAIAINNPEYQALAALDGSWYFNVMGENWSSSILHAFRKDLIREIVVVNNDRSCKTVRAITQFEWGYGMTSDFPECTNNIYLDPYAHLLESGEYEMVDYRNHQRYVFSRDGQSGTMSGCAYVQSEPDKCMPLLVTRTPIE